MVFLFVLQNNIDYLHTICSLSTTAQLRLKEFYLFYLIHFKSKIIRFLNDLEVATSVPACGESQVCSWKSKEIIWYLPRGVKFFRLDAFPYLFPTVRNKDPVGTFSEAQSREAVVPCDVKIACSNYSSSICITQMSQACILETNICWQSPGLVLVYISPGVPGVSLCPKGHQTGAADSKESGFLAVEGSTHGLCPSPRHITPNPEQSKGAVHPSLENWRHPQTLSELSLGTESQWKKSKPSTHPLSQPGIGWWWGSFSP